MSFINNDELERNLDQIFLHILHKYLIGSDQDGELVDLGCLEDASFSGDVGVKPFKCSYVLPTCLTIGVVIQYAVEICPVFPGTFPVI